MSKGKIVIIDGNSLINRTYYGLPLLSTKDGIYTNAIYGFVNMLYKIFDEYDPEYMAVAFDRKAPTFRHLSYTEYKAGRKKMPEELAQQLPILKEILDAFKINRIEIDGFEADDLIGTLVKFSEEKDINPIVITGDKDALQLASEKTRILITKKGISNLEEYNEKEVIEKYGVTPTEFIDVKGLMGDQSDNIPGVPSIGEKTAIKLIKEYGSIENLLNNVDKLSSKKMKEKLETYAEQAIMSKKLATIVTNVPVEISLEDMKKEEPDGKALQILFNKLEFRKLIEKIHIGEEETEKIDTIVIDSIEEVSKLKEIIKKKGELCFKIFSNQQDVSDDKMIGISMLVDYKIYYIDLCSNVDLINELKDILEDENIKKYGHKLKQDILILRQYDIDLSGIYFDLAVAVYLIDPTRKEYDLSDIAIQYLGKRVSSEEELLGKGKKKILYSEVEKGMLISYGANWCNTVDKLKDLIVGHLRENELEKLYFDIELPLIEILADMEFQGFMVNKSKLMEIGTVLDSKINHLTLEIYKDAEGVFNINSTKQLGNILFEKLNLPPIKKTKTGYSTNAEVLEKLYDKHGIIPKIIEYRQIVKLKSTYIDGLSAVINPYTKKIHSSFNQTVTSTGRISSTEPNLQNIPVKLEMGRNIRKVFVPTSEEYMLLDADYSQIELRVLAHISQDENLIEAFHKDEDIHKTTASKVFDVPMDEVTSIQRSRAKAVNFGIVYGISDYGLSENLHITRNEAKQYIDEYLKKYEGVKNYMDKIVEEGKEKGYVTTLFNRIRYIPELKSKNFNLRSFGERTAMNTPIQGTAADIIKIAMIKVYFRLKNEKLKSTLILQVHDELIVETHKDEIEKVKKIVKEEMENAVQLDVPLKVDMNIGQSWYDTK